MGLNAVIVIAPLLILFPIAPTSLYMIHHSIPAEGDKELIVMFLCHTSLEKIWTRHNGVDHFPYLLYTIFMINRLLDPSIILLKEKKSAGRPMAVIRVFSLSTPKLKLRQGGGRDFSRFYSPLTAFILFKTDGVIDRKVPTNIWEDGEDYPVMG